MNSAIENVVGLICEDEIIMWRMLSPALGIPFVVKYLSCPQRQPELLVFRDP